MRAVFRASAWLDAGKNRTLAVEILARSEHLSMSPDLIDPALSGQITPRLNHAPEPVERFVQFHKHAASFPWRSQAAWIAKQLGADAAGIQKAKDCFRTDLYRHNLDGIGADIPGASEKVEGALRFETALASTNGHMILAQDAFFDSKTFDFPGEKR
jgi:NitT/TauT family transport system ATP-binding protein